MAKNIKLGTRYVLIVFVMFLCYKVTSADYILKLKDIDSTLLSVVTGAVFGALTLIVKNHFETKVDND